MDRTYRRGVAASLVTRSLVNVGVAAAFVAACLLPTATASAQGLGGIAGVVRDTSGAVLPGVTVEASSPVLIEKVRTAVTNGEGRYTIVNMPPGRYSVVFTLPGFKTFRRDDVALQGAFTASVDAEMSVGTLEETVTVSGEAPLVDTRNVGSRVQVSRETLETLPSGHMNSGALISMTPGMSGPPQVGPSSGYRGSLSSNAQNIYHGRRGNGSTIEGVKMLGTLGTGTYSFVPNPLMFGEMTIDTGGSAESQGDAITFNQLPKDGGNTFSGSIEGFFANDALEGSNLTDDLRRQGLRDVDKLDYNFQVGGTLGGPIAVDKLWFFTAFNYTKVKRFEVDSYFNATQDTLFYTPDLSRQAFRDEYQRAGGGRVTWQMTPRNKLNVMLDYQANCQCRSGGSATAPEARSRFVFFPSAFVLGTWTSTLSNRLLLQVGSSAAIAHWTMPLQPEVTATNIAVTDVGTGRSYGANINLNSPSSPRAEKRFNQRVALSYVTGSHSAKVGAVIEEISADFGFGYERDDRPFIGDRTYTFANQVPVSITQWARPYTMRNRGLDLGVFAQDQWTLGRVTLNYGLRFDYFNGRVAPQDAPANAFMPARSFGKVSGVPAWTDLSPRGGVAWDLFGDGGTAVKVSVGRYVAREATSVPEANNPFATTVNSTTRTWSDADRDYVPDCDLANFKENGECGPIANAAFGQSVSVVFWDKDLLEGFGARPADWDTSVEFQHQLTRGLSATVGYYHNWSENFRVGDNVAAEASDFDEYCVTAPQHALLPGGGGFQVCGLYDIDPAKFGQENIRVRRASHYGSETRVADFVGLNMEARFDGGAFVRGGVDVGRTVFDNCEIRAVLPELGPVGANVAFGVAGENNGGTANPTNPFCKVSEPLIGNLQVKMQGSYPLPGDVVVSAVFQNVPTASINAVASVANADIAPSLGRNLAACGSRTIATCTARVNVTLTAPGTNWQDRLTQLDLRVSKILRMGGSQLQASVDLYNALNASAVLAYNGTIGPAFGRPQGVLGARLITVNGRWSF